MGRYYKAHPAPKEDKSATVGGLEMDSSYSTQGALLQKERANEKAALSYQKCTQIEQKSPKKTRHGYALMSKIATQTCIKQGDRDGAI